MMFELPDGSDLFPTDIPEPFRRQRLYWIWWLREQMIASTRQFLISRLPDLADPEADAPQIVAAKGGAA